MKPFHLLPVLLLLTGFTIASKSVKLEYKFEVGDQYEWTQTTKQSIKQSIMGMDQLIENNIKGSLILKVVNLTTTGAEIETTYKSLSMETKLPAGMPGILLDSDGDSEKIENKVMRTVIDKPFKLFLNRQGVVEKIEGEENLTSGFSSLDLASQQVAAMKTSLEQTLNKGSLKSSFESALTNYPEAKIKIGDSWKNKVGGSSSFPIETENTWKLDGLESNKANVTADGVTTTTDKQKRITLPNGIKSTFDLSGNQKVVSSVNLKTGWPSTVNVTSEIKGNMNLLAGGMIPQDMEVPMVITTSSDFLLVKK